MCRLTNKTLIFQPCQLQKRYLGKSWQKKRHNRQSSLFPPSFFRCLGVNSQDWSKPSCQAHGSWLKENDIWGIRGLHRRAWRGFLADSGILWSGLRTTKNETIGNSCVQSSYSLPFATCQFPTTKRNPEPSNKNFLVKVLVKVGANRQESWMILCS